ncbi:hypothetical protein BIW11_09380 [Tropilaelaps mercedesae]|uniref:PHD-type domain-containing protein n=1 Tax=Tropilaelaps mercedesae TaxID=418985 RepID=A0A1V9XKT1_9ACAR|nr:hypothetical protein BIW11_09380 [Tropilaelaps mercedesae]
MDVTAFILASRLAAATSSEDVIRYLIELGKCAHAFTNGAGRTETNTEDVFLAFNEFGITESELLDYLLNVDSLPFPTKLPRFPVQQSAQLCFPKIDDPQRPEWIPTYLPATRPESEHSAVVPANPGGTNNSNQLIPTVTPAEDDNSDQQPQVVPTSPQVLPEEGAPMREVIFIQMTPSGFLSAIRDGRLPDPCLPSKLLLDPRSSEHENSSDDEPNPNPLKTTQGITATSAKATGKKRKRGGKTAAEAKADKFFDEKIATSNNNSNNKDNNIGSLITSIKLEKQGGTNKEKKIKNKDKDKEKMKDLKGLKEKDSKEKEPLLLKTKKGKKRKNPGGGRAPKPKTARLSSPVKEEGASRRVPIVTTKIPRADSTKSTNNPPLETDSGRSKKPNARVSNEIYSDADSQSSMKLKGDNDRMPTPQPPPPPPVKLKVSKTERDKKKERVLKGHRTSTGLAGAANDMADSKETVKEDKQTVVVGKKEAKGELLRSIDDAISTVIAEARRNISSRSPVDERGRKKLVVKDVFFSDSEPEMHRDPSPHSDDDIEVIDPIKKTTLFLDHPKTPDLSPTGSGYNVFTPTVPSKGGDSYRDFCSSELRPSKTKVSPLEELVRQMPLRMASDHVGGAEDSNSRLLTPSVTITPVPQTPLNPIPPPTPTLAPPTPTLTVKTLAERKGLPPLEVDPDKKKKKEKRKDKKDKKAGGKKKEVPKLTLKLSSAASVSEPLFEPTQLISTAAVSAPPKAKPEPTTDKIHVTPKGKRKNSILRSMVTEVESDSETSLPVVERVSPTAKQKTPRVKEIKEPKEAKEAKAPKSLKTPKEQPPKKESKSQQQQPQQQQRSPKKEKQTPPKLTSPLPPVLPEITITPIPAPSLSKKDKKKEKPVKEGKKKKAEKVVEEAVEKTKVKVKEEKSPRLSKAAVKEEPKEERPVRGKKDKDHEKEHVTPKKDTKKELAKANKEKDKQLQEAQVEVVTVGTILDAEGNKIWICPACAKPDDGSPMIGCDQCDDWYHWECVGISVPPSAEEEWFCVRCTKLRNKPHKKHRK